VFGGGRFPPDDPAVDILVVSLQQRLEGGQLGLSQILGVLIREGPQNEVHFPETTPPGAHPQAFQASVIHAGGGI
jgi:hypothetical protein